MEFLYSDILPLPTTEAQQTIKEAFIQQIKNADSLEIAVGYVSCPSLKEIDDLVKTYSIKHITLIIGMYYIDGIPEQTFHLISQIHQKWQKSKIGEIRLVRPFKYHGKLYCFYKDNKAFAVINGSANLGFLKVDASNNRQYEIATLLTEPKICLESAEFVKSLITSKCSAPFHEVSDKITKIRNLNTSLSGVECVTKILKQEVDSIQTQNRITNITFELPLKVPAFNDRFKTEKKYYTKSNLNVCYAKPRSISKPRDWYEVQITVSREVTRIPGYPEKNKPFFIITDDGYCFKAHTTSSGNKQFSAVGDELILGRWIKGRLAAAGLVTPINNTAEDKQRLGMITKEMLAEYGCNKLVFTKTTFQLSSNIINVSNNTNDSNNESPADTEYLDVWFLSFKSSNEN